jgi:nitroreductase
MAPRLIIRNSGDKMTAMRDRHPDFPVDPLFLDRWSPRAFDQTSIRERDLMTLFEAARWAPSCNNAQPWRFVYALRETASWTRFLDLLNPFNRSWAENAAAWICPKALPTSPIFPCRCRERPADRELSADFQ